MVNYDEIKRKVAEPTEVKNKLFETEETNNFDSEWWGMPTFENENIASQYKISINFLTADDVREFAKLTGINVTPNSNSGWFPNQEKLKPNKYFYTGPKCDSKYPVCIPSKGRADCQTTGKRLDELGVSYKFFVEETEGDIYKEYLGEEKVVVMPFHDLGQGSIPARNFIWEWAKEREYKRHWVVDDNIKRFARTNLTRRLSVKGGCFFRAMEDFIDRYTNIVMAGLHHTGFVNIGWYNIGPYKLNSRVYSCILLDTNLTERWRGKYNEDTDLSLRLLKKGYCTLLFHALIMQKGDTSGTKQSKAMKGGNTDNVYNTNDYRLNFAKSLQEQHPDCVKVVWKFNRWHHQVDYNQFLDNKPILRDDIVPTVGPNEYRMELVKNSER